MSHSPYDCLQLRGAPSLFKEYTVDEIYRMLEDIVTLAEMQDEFFEVETMVCIRRRGGAESDFIRMQLDLTDGVRVLPRFHGRF